MGNSVIHRDSAGFRARSLDVAEFSAVAAWLILGLDPAGGHDDIGRLTSALCTASDGLWGNRIFWLIERPDGGVVALAHSALVASGVPRFDGLVWLFRDKAVEPAPFSTPGEAICSIAAFCRRFLGYPVSSSFGTPAVASSR